MGLVVGRDRRHGPRRRLPGRGRRGGARRHAAGCLAAPTAADLIYGGAFAIMMLMIGYSIAWAVWWLRRR